MVYMSMMPSNITDATPNKGAMEDFDRSNPATVNIIDKTFIADYYVHNYPLRYALMSINMS